MTTDRTLELGPWRPRFAAWSGPGVVIEGLEHAHGDATPDDYVNEVLLTAEHRAAFLALIDRAGLVVCKHVGGDDGQHRDVRGRSSRGRLSQGEYYHHDGCSGPTKPRVVEIRCPYQNVERRTATAIAPFPEVLYAQLLGLPDALVSGELATWRDTLRVDGLLPAELRDIAQGLVNRSVRRELDPESARAYLRAVDVHAGAYREPWTMGESRFIANANVHRTWQHRRAYLEPHTGGFPNGKLVKRWPDGPALEDHD